MQLGPGGRTPAWSRPPGGDVTIDLAALRVTLPDGTRAPFPLEPFARHCLLEGVDELAFLLAQEADIAAYERRNPDSLGGATHDVRRSPYCGATASVRR